MIAIICFALAVAFQWKCWTNVVMAYIFVTDNKLRDTQHQHKATLRYLAFSALSIGFAALGGYSL